jgi:hydroxyacylglutathione hydrolase
MKMEIMPVGMINANCYLVWDENADNAAAIIDPGGDGDKIIAAIQRLQLNVQCILLTHGHFDHVLGVPTLLQEYPDLPVYLNEKDYAEARDGGQFGYAMGEVSSIHFYDEGDTITVGGITFEVLCTPGQTPGSVTLRAGDILFTGDTLFRGSCGRTDFPNGSFADMQKSLQRLSQLDGNYRVYPGHEGSTTLDYERRYNPFMAKRS